MAHYKDDFSFGSKAFQEFHHGKNKDGARSKGDLAHRAKDGYKKADTKKAQAEAAETQRADLETQNAIHEKETRLMEALIKGGSYAVKIAPPNGFITPLEVESFQANGWQVFPAGTAPAKVGGKLGAVEPWDTYTNPTQPKRRATAWILYEPKSRLCWDGAGASSYDNAEQFPTREAAKAKAAELGGAWQIIAMGARTAKAQAKWAEGLEKRKAAPAKAQKDQAPDQAQPLTAILGPELKARAVVVASPKPMSLENLWDWRRAGYEVSLAPLSYRRGIKRARVNPTPDAQKAIYLALVKAAEPLSVDDLTTRLKADPGAILAGLQRLEAMGLAHPSQESLFGSLWSPGPKAERGLFANPQPVEREKTSKKAKLTRQTATDRDTPKFKNAHNGEMATPKTPKKPNKVALNPDRLAEVWEMWTGEARPSLTVDMEVEDRLDMPDRVVLLGRVTEIIGQKQSRMFGDTNGPLIVTDEELSKVWIVSKKPLKFAIDLTDGVFGYLACKPKFGDRNVVKWLHRFEKARAVISGNVGHLSGTFRITPAGFEG